MHNSVRLFLFMSVTAGGFFSFAACTAGVATIPASDTSDASATTDASGSTSSTTNGPNGNGGSSPSPMGSSMPTGDASPEGDASANACPCVDGFYCDLATSTCKPGCASADDCEPNQTCDPGTHTCVVKVVTCELLAGTYVIHYTAMNNLPSSAVACTAPADQTFTYSGDAGAGNAPTDGGAQCTTTKSGCTTTTDCSGTFTGGTYSTHSVTTNASGGTGYTSTSETKISSGASELEDCAISAVATKE